MPFGYGWQGSASRGLSHASLGPRSRLKELTLSCPLTSKCAPLHTGSQHREAATTNNYKPKWFLDKLKLATAAACNLEKAYPHLEYEIHQTIPKHLPLWCISFWNPVLLCSNGWLRTHREPSFCASWEPSYIFALRFFFLSFLAPGVGAIWEAESDWLWTTPPTSVQQAKVEPADFSLLGVLTRGWIMVRLHLVKDSVP